MTAQGVHASVSAQTPNYLHTEGSKIVDASGRQVLVTGLSWFGMETENYAPHGLWARSLSSLLDQIVALNFNTIRLPYSNQLFDAGSVPNGINFDLNPDLNGLTGLEIMDRVIAGAGERGLKVILDRHRPDSRAQSELWYTPAYSEARWINDWVMLAGRYAGNDTVIGADLHNEPRGGATWGSDDPATDWRLAAERAGNAILAVNPNLLIIVQGVEHYQGAFYWWGGNLMGVRDHPVRLTAPDRLVYSPHTYGPGVYPQKWFSDPAFPANMPGIWDQHWGYVQKEGLAPLILGEFGGRSVANDQEGIWQRALVDYLRQSRISYLYWTLNPNSGDTGGILLDDWQTVDPQKEALLSSYQFPLIGSGEGPAELLTGAPETQAPAASATAIPTAAPTSTPIPATVVSPTAPAHSETAASAPGGTEIVAATPVALAAGLQVRYYTSQPAAKANDAKPEFIIANGSGQPVRLGDLELVYWFKDSPGRNYEFYCDWAQIGCDKLSGEFEALGDGGYSLHIRFHEAAGEIPPGGESGEIKLRFNRADYSDFDQSDDFSFSSASQYTAWDRVSLYQGGQRVWGSEPASVQVSTATAAPTELAATPQPAQSPALPAGTPQTGPVEGAAAGRWGLWVFIAGAFAAGFLIAAILMARSRR